MDHSTSKGQRATSRLDYNIILLMFVLIIIIMDITEVVIVTYTMTNLIIS